ncbi:hypothetical protein [Pediococcus pentosaceus]|uniref:hypothetical protein n=1 Tax=Pediococcus pentosaceus TaxID=1255 RepID=UPI0021E6DA64|nr:hypothetical protein [Pediococcus pentosaceus]MCV3318976.1 hypothetical protein [Pediococcus pentosaceus]
MTEKKGLSGSQKLQVHVSGPEMNKSKGYKLDDVISSLQDVQNLINKTYLALNDRRRFTDKNSEKIVLRVDDFKEGSLIADLNIVYSDIVVPIMPIVASNPDFFIDVIKNAYKFLKTKLKAESEGKEVQTVINNESTAVNVMNNNGTIVINSPQGMDQVASSLQPEFTKLAQNIDTTGVSNISLSSLSNNDVSNSLELNQEDRRIFSGNVMTSDDIYTIIGKITSGNFETNSGRILIIESNTDAIAKGQTYNVTINKELHAEERWKEMFLSERPYYCSYSGKFDASQGFKVTKVNITDWDEDNWN